MTLAHGGLRDRWPFGGVNSRDCRVPELFWNVLGRFETCC